MRPGDEFRVLTARCADGLAASPAVVALPVVVLPISKFAQTDRAVGLILLIILPERLVERLVIIRKLIEALCSAHVHYLDDAVGLRLLEEIAKNTVRTRRN